MKTATARNALGDNLDAVPERPVLGVLAVGITDEDYTALTSIFRHSNWRLFRARTGSEAVRLLRGYDIGVALVPGTVHEAAWRELVGPFDGVAKSPLVIAIIEPSDSHSWAVALNRGVYDVLCRPLSSSEAVHVLSLAWLHWNEQTAAEKRG